MDINSYRSRVDVQPIQVNRSDTVPSDSIRINRFKIEWDQDGQPYQAFDTDQTDHEPAEDEKQFVQQGVVEFDNSFVIQKNPLQFLKDLAKFIKQESGRGFHAPSYKTLPMYDLIDSYIYHYVKNNLFTAQFPQDLKHYWAKIMNTYLSGNDMRNKFIRGITDFTILDLINGRYLSLLDDDSGQLEKLVNEKNNDKIYRNFIKPILNEIIYLASTNLQYMLRDHPQKMKYLTGDKTKMEHKKPEKTNTIKINGNPLIQRTLRNLQLSQIKGGLINECDAVKNHSITARVKQIIELTDAQGHVIKVIDNLTNPELFEKLKSTLHATEQNEEHEQHEEQQEQRMPMIRHDQEQQYDDQEQPCECEEEQEEEFNMPMGFGVTPLHAINQVSFKHPNDKMFEGLQTLTNDITKILTQNTEPIVNVVQQKKELKQIRKKINNKK